MLICQLQNLGWDARLRRRWARVLLGAVTTWTLLGVLVGYVADLTIDQTVLRWYLPAAAALLLGLDGYRAQREIAAYRERLVPRVQADLENATHPHCRLPHSTGCSRSPARSKTSCSPPASRPSASPSGSTAGSATPTSRTSKPTPPNSAANWRTAKRKTDHSRAVPQHEFTRNQMRAVHEALHCI